MPLGKWSSFGQCVGAQKRMGHSDESARKICGSIQAETEGGSSSSQEGKYGAADMSQEMDKPKEDNGGGSSVTFSESEITQLVQAAADEGATKTLALLKEKVDIEEEGPGPAGPPTKKPPFA